MALQHLKKVTDQIINKSFDKAAKAYSSVVGAFSNETDKRWILDIDDPVLNEIDMPAIMEYVNTLQPISEEDKTISILPSKSGFHIITRPFNLKDFKQNYPEIEVHKNNPTNLYIP